MYTGPGTYLLMEVLGGPDRVDSERLGMGDIGIFVGIFGSTNRNMRGNAGGK